MVAIRKILEMKNFQKYMRESENLTGNIQMIEDSSY